MIEPAEEEYCPSSLSLFFFGVVGGECSVLGPAPEAGRTSEDPKEGRCHLTSLEDDGWRDS